MRDQYAGDISDMIKYSLLRVLADSDKTIGVGWYYNPVPDNSNNGQYVGYLTDENWSKLDKQVWASLNRLISSERSLANIENLPIWPVGTRFHRTPIPDILIRDYWATDMTACLKECDLIFLDPDNGIGNSKKHARLEEIKLLRDHTSRAILVIKFPGRTNFLDQSIDHHQLLQNRTGSNKILTMRISIVVPTLKGGLAPRFRWFTLMDHDKVLKDRFYFFAERLNELKGCRIKADIFSTT